MDSHLFSTDQSKEYYLEEGCFIIEILNQASAPDISISQARVEMACETKPHKLKEIKEWYYIVQGQGQMHIEEHAFEVKKGEVVYIPENAVQWIKNTGENDLIFLCTCKPRWEAEKYEEVIQGKDL